MYKLTAGLVAVILLAGCADFRMQQSLAKSSAMSAASCRQLPAYYDVFSNMDKADRAQELILAKEAWLFDPEDCNQLRLAMILSHPDNSGPDHSKALKLLNDLLEDDFSFTDAERQMAGLLRDQLQQLQAQELLSRALRNELRQARKESAQRLRRVTDLETQLEQLINIEENINEMEQAIITPAATDNGPDEPAQNPAGR